jgi:hypothetical protein
MKPQDHADAQLELVRQYWRVKATVAMVTSVPLPYRDATVVAYAGIPAAGLPVAWLNNETVGHALRAFLDYADARLPRDFFMAQIALFEERMSFVLRISGKPSHGTLGQLLGRVEANWAMSAQSKGLAAEVLCRRNTLIHESGLADQKYVDARLVAAAYRHLALQMPFTVGDSVVPDSSYLSHCAEVLILYSSELP